MSEKIPTPEEIQKEFEEFVKQKFGGKVEIMAVQSREDMKDFDDIAPAKESQEKQNNFEFDFLPKDIKSYLDRFVIKQNEAKKALSIAVCDHYNHASESQKANKDFTYSKQNVLLLGPTGVGKTYLVELIADLVGVPFVKADATRFSETGYVGNNVDDLVRDLVAKADGDIAQAQYGIVYLDEADKLASTNSMGKDISGRGVQIGLLKLMEETEVDLKVAHDMVSQLQSVMDFQKNGKENKRTINTKNILFIVSGSFSNLEDIISKRMNLRQIGLKDSSKNINNKNINLFNHVVTKDLVDFGFEPEFIGRLPIKVGLDLLDEKDLFKILTDSEGSIVKQYRDSFRAYGIAAKFTEGALREIARLAVEEKTGARALMTVFEKILRDYKFELPSSDIKDLEITLEVAKNPKIELEKLLFSSSTSHYQQ